MWSQGADSHIAVVPYICVPFSFDSLQWGQKLQCFCWIGKIVLCKVQE